MTIIELDINRKIFCEGHYTAFATNSQAWFNFNDVNVKETDFQNVQSSKAYILFYVQRDFNRAMNS